MSTPTDAFYLTTPIYYVNDRPHIGHVYTTVVADIAARYHRLRGDETFFLTGTDEHAAKVVDTAAERGLTPQQWADRNAAAFQQTFRRLGLTFDDFIRTSEDRHTERVERYVKALMDSGAVYLGEYEGWYDPGQEEYIPENKAKEYDYISPFNGRPFVRRSETNYFFRLSDYAGPLLQLIDAGEAIDGEHFRVEPEARRNEVIARIREGLNDVPISRVDEGEVQWGIRVPGDPQHRIYVWIDALFNYLSTIDTDDRRHYWPADVHLIGKEILWFHAVIWPAMILALRQQAGYQWVALPRFIYAHSFWISEGQKMSKSLGNFIDLETIDSYIDTFGLDALRYYIARNGPMGASDADFAEAKFTDLYNGDLANGLGNCFSRIANMTHKYFGGELPAPGPDVEASHPYHDLAHDCVARFEAAMAELSPDKACGAAQALIGAIDGYIEQTQPFKLARDESRLPEVGTILYNCAEAIRIASLLLWPVIPEKVEALWRRMGLAYGEQLAERGRGALHDWAQWGRLEPGTPIEKGAPLFPRQEVARS